MTIGNICTIFYWWWGYLLTILITWPKSGKGPKLASPLEKNQAFKYSTPHLRLRWRRLQGGLLQIGYFLAHYVHHLSTHLRICIYEGM